MRSNPERGFRDELHGACTQEWSSTRGEGVPDSDMQVMTQLNMTIAQVYCYLPNTTELTANDTQAIVNTAAQLSDGGTARVHATALRAARTTDNDLRGRGVGTAGLVRVGLDGDGLLRDDLGLLAE